MYLACILEGLIKPNRSILCLQTPNLRRYVQDPTIGRKEKVNSLAEAFAQSNVLTKNFIGVCFTIIYCVISLRL